MTRSSDVGRRQKIILILNARNLSTLRSLLMRSVEAEEADSVLEFTNKTFTPNKQIINRVRRILTRGIIDNAQSPQSGVHADGDGKHSTTVRSDYW